MHKYFVDAELNSMLGSTYDSSDYSEVYSKQRSLAHVQTSWTEHYSALNYIQLVNYVNTTLELSLETTHQSQSVIFLNLDRWLAEIVSLDSL